MPLLPTKNYSWVVKGIEETSTRRIFKQEKKKIVAHYLISKIGEAASGPWTARRLPVPRYDVGDVTIPHPSCAHPTAPHRHV